MYILYIFMCTFPYSQCTSYNVQPTATTEQRNDLSSFPSYTVNVDYDKTVEQLLVNIGGSDNYITSQHFPSNESGHGQVVIYLVSLKEKINYEDVLEELDRQGLRPATLKELLALGDTYLDLGLIVAFGSTWRDSADGRLAVPCLNSFDSGHTVFHYLLDGDWWFPALRFAAVQK